MEKSGYVAAAAPETTAVWANNLGKYVVFIVIYQ